MAYTAWTVERATLSSNLAIKPTNQALDLTSPGFGSGNGNRFVNSGRTRLIVHGNTGATGQIRLKSPSLCNQAGTHHLDSTANDLDTTTEHLVWGPWPTTRMNNAAGEIEVEYSGTLTGVTVNVVEDPAL